MRRIPPALLVVTLLVASAPVIAGVSGAQPIDAEESTGVGAEHAPDASLAVSSETVGNAFLTTETPTFEVTADGDVEWSVQDYWGGTVASGNTDTDGASDLELPIDDPGYYEVTIRAGGQRERRSFAVLEPDPRDLDHSFYGIHAAFHKSLENDPNQLITLVDMMGAEHVRGSLIWSEIEHERGVFEYTENQKDMMNRYERHGIKPMLILRGGNQLYFDPVSEEQKAGNAAFRIRFTVPPNDAGYEAYADYTREIVTQYPEQIDSVEVWNEYNHGAFVGGDEVTPARYKKLLQAAYPTVQEANPDVRVVGGALAFGGDIPTWVDGIGETGGYQYMDTLSVHPYRKTTIPEGAGGSRGSIEDEMERLQETMATHSDDPPKLSITEIGWPTNGTQSQADERDQGQYVPRTYLFGQAANLEQVYYYGFKDQSWKLRGSGAMVRARSADLGSMAVKRGFVTYAAMTRSLKGAEFQGKDDVGGENTYSFVFERDGEPVRALWSLEETDVTLETDDSVTLRTVVGETRTLEPTDGEVEVTLSEDVLYVHGAVDDVSTGARANVTAHDAARGSRVPVTLAYDNTDGDRERSVTFEAGDRSASLTVPAGERASKRVRVSGRETTGPRIVHATVTVDGERSGLLRASATARSPFEVSMTPRVEAGETELSRPAEIDLSLRNYRTQRAASVSHVEWSARLRADSAEEHAGTAQLDAEVGGGTSQSVTVPLEGVGDWQPYRPYTVNATVHFESGESIQVGGTVTPFSPAPRHTVTVDGDVSDGGDLPAARLPRDGDYWLPSNDQEFSGPEDLGGRMRLTQDDEHLYLQVNARDDEHVQPAHVVGDAWKGDSIQFAVAAGQPGDADRFSVYTFALNASGEPILKRIVSPRAGGTPPASKADVAVVRHADRDRTVYELAIPWSEIEGFDGPADEFSASLLINDNDGDGRKGWVEWGSGVGQTRDSALFRPIQRVGAVRTDDGGSTGEDADSSTDTPTETDVTPTAAPEPSGEDGGMDAGTDNEGGANEPEPTAGQSPGLGVVAALLALLIGAIGWRRRQ